MNSGNGNGWMDNFKTFLTKAQEGPNRENRNVYAENHPQYGTRVVVQLIEDQIIPVSLNDNIEKKIIAMIPFRFKICHFFGIRKPR